MSAIASNQVAVAQDMVDVDVKLHSGSVIGVFMASDWHTLQKLKIPGTSLAMDLKVRPVFTYLQYLRSIHLPAGLSKTTSISKTVGESTTTTVEESISDTIKASAGIVEDETSFSLSLGFSQTWESSRTTEDSFTLTGPTSIYFYQPVTVIVHQQTGPFPSPFLGGYPAWAVKVLGTASYMLASVKLDRTIGLNKSVGLVSFKDVCTYLYGDGWKKWKPGS